LVLGANRDKAADKQDLDNSMRLQKPLLTGKLMYGWRARAALYSERFMTSS
jgi:hypothetical protein